MKIDGSGPIRTTGNVRRSARSDKGGDAGFANHLKSEEASSTAAKASASPITALDSILAAQEVDDATQGRRRGVRRGNDLLDRLEEIRHGLLLGAIPVPRLQALAVALRSERARVLDPKLSAIIAEIEIRCAVELAKLGQYVDLA